MEIMRGSSDIVAGSALWLLATTIASAFVIGSTTSDKWGSPVFGTGAMTTVEKGVYPCSYAR